MIEDLFMRAPNMPSLKRTIAKIEKGEQKIHRKEEIQLVPSFDVSMTCSVLRKRLMNMHFLIISFQSPLLLFREKGILRTMIDFYYVA